MLLDCARLQASEVLDFREILIFMFEMFLLDYLLTKQKYNVCFRQKQSPCFEVWSSHSDPGKS